ncbi:folate-binding protein [Paracoccus sp. S-4012]|uniref:CAF17-like 4Fe-4S cluster assembly/insertion protein YgfZ n=1 Tax=Paracoccus sp. S-4012 TaxID=2665648 RepID=UPI0012B0B492|nr:folate-binding protein YgfZ [Paracoccus sp. S-4012]MRX51222.1 folate-binding protein [Paracoccus sp. S-4012]
MDRRLIAVTGADAADFLQGLVTNDVHRADGGGLVWSALLTAQGKYLADFFILGREGGYWIDAAAAQAEDLTRRLGMYRLRAAVDLAPVEARVARGTGPAPDGAVADPRHPALGWRHYGGGVLEDDGTDWDAIRVEHVIPETGIELIPNESFILEAGLERLHGVDFRKGCYVGQEVTARMRHKTELRKGLMQVRVEGEAPLGTPILMADGREAGTLYTQSGGRGIAQMRFDRIGPGMKAGDAVVTAEPRG